jgi:hypothetical protein
MDITTLVQNVAIVEALAPAADAGGRTSDWVNLKRGQQCWVVCHINQGAANTVTLTLAQATVVAGSDTKALTNNVKVWANEDLATADGLTAQSDAKSFTTSAATKHKLVVFEIGPAALDYDAKFCCISVTTGASAAANITEALFLIESRYSPLPSFIMD